MRRTLVAAAVVVSSATIPAAASAATTLGSDLSPEPNSSGCFGGDPCTETNTTLPGAQLTAPVDGVVVRWRVRAADTDPGGNTLRLKVIRDPTGSGAFTSLRTSETRTVPDHGGTPQTFTFSSQLPIAAGDRIALDLDAASDGTLDLAIHVSQPGTTLVLWNPTLADGTTPLSPDMTFAPGEEAMFNADMEPDADADGFGDETQDQCPTDASTQGQCPPDTDPPETKITKSPPNKTKKPKAKYKFTSSEPGSAFECKLKGKGLKKSVKKYKDCDSPRKYKRLNEGKFKFAVRAIDQAGNVDPAPAKDKFRVVG
jgi:hypothetical protein